MNVSKSARRDARQLLRSCLVDGELNEGRVRECVNRIADARLRGAIPLLEQFQRLVKLELERRTARIESAKPLSSPLADEIANSLNRIYGNGLKISFTQDPALLGGLRIKVGSDVYDSSVKTRLKRLEETF
jgi:F-type H+-transporting ATPase subunit delta